MSLSRDQLNQIRPTFPTETVPSPEFGDDAELKVRSMSLDQLDRVNKFRVTEPGQEMDSKFVHALIAASLVDDEGNLLFDVENGDDLAVIGSWPRTLTERMAAAVVQLIGVDGNKAVEAAKGNSEAGQTGD